jgi:hypothetical protein
MVAASVRVDSEQIAGWFLFKIFLHSALWE